MIKSVRKAARVGTRAALKQSTSILSSRLKKVSIAPCELAEVWQ